MGFFHLMGHVCKSSQGRLLWTVYHHGLHFFAGENTNATLFPSDFLFPSALISPDPSGRKKAMPSSNAFADQMQTEETSRSISFLVSYHQFAYQTTCWVEALKFWYRLSWNLSGRTTNSHSLIFPWYLRHTYNPNQGTKI